MKWISINKKVLGNPLYVTPNYDDGSHRSIIEYLSGIPELDSTLAETGRPFSAMNVELSMLVYEHILMFMLVQGSKEKGHFTIDRDKVVKINARHKQTLNIRKDPAIDTRFVAKILEIFGAVITTIARLIKVKIKSQPVLGSVFEIVLDSTIDGQNEKIAIACTDKNKEIVKMICSKIIK